MRFLFLFLLFFFFFLALFFEFAQSYQAERKVEPRDEQTPFRDKLNLPPTAGDGNYSGSGNQARSLWFCKVHSESQSLSSLYFLRVCQAVCLPFSSSLKFQIQKESKTAVITSFLFLPSSPVRSNFYSFRSSY